MLTRFAAVATLAFLPAACGQAPQTSDVRPAPAFDLPAVEGGRVSLASLKGKVVVLDMWATWCGPCIAEMPDYAEFARKNQPRGVEVVGIVFASGEPQEVQDFVREHRIPYRQLLGPDELLDSFGASSGFPTTFVIDAQGMIRLKLLGAVPQKFEKLQKAVDEALVAKGA
jgi:thiol-disulfide isomerase/thioredoxin